MTRLARVYLYLQSLGLLAFGLYFWANPVAAGAAIDIAPLNPIGASELRGFYGGGFVGMAALMALGLRSRAAWASGALVSVGTVMALVVVGRLISAGFDGLSAKAAGAGAFELLIALACWAIVRKG